jgi:hypothetical protein
VSLRCGVVVNLMLDPGPTKDVDGSGAGGHLWMLSIWAMLRGASPGASSRARRPAAVALRSGARGGTTSGALA